MAKFQNKILAGKKVVFAHVGEIEIDAEGFFESASEALTEELKKVPGFVAIHEPKKPAAVAKPAVPVAPAAPAKEEVKPAAPVAPAKEETKITEPAKS